MNARSRRAGWLTPLGLVLPGAILTVFVLVGPLIQLSRMAFYRVSRFGGLEHFAGLENFARLWADPSCFGAALHTSVWTLAVVGGTVLVSLPVALLLDLPFLGRSLARVLVLLPWAVSLTSTAIVWRRALNGQSGLLNTILIGLGILREPVTWLGSPAVAFVVEIVVAILVSVPFCVAILLSGLAAMPADVYEAARMDGAGAFARFRHITLPLLRPFLIIVAIFNVAYVPNSFPIIWVLTQGGPANRTDILVTYMYKLAFVFGRLGDAAALSLVMLVILFGSSILMIRLASAASAVD